MSTIRDVGDIRRDKGTGGKPHQRADGRWSAHYIGADGRRHYVYAPTERECERKRDRAIREAAVGIDPSQQPLAEYLTRHLRRQARSLSAVTVERYDRIIRLHIAGTRVGRTPLARVRADDLDDLYADALAAGMAPKGVELLHTVIHGALAEAARRGHVIRNEADTVRRPRVRRSPRPTYTADEVVRLKAAAEGHRLEAFVALAVSVGLRHGELLGLRWPDVDLDAGLLRLRDPEKGGPPRTLLLTADTVRILRAHRARQAAAQLAAGGAYEETRLITAGHFGEPMDRRQVRVELYRIEEAAGLRPMTVHGLRHTFATIALERGVAMKVVQEMLGHESMRQTADVYSHVSETLQERARLAMQEAIG